jgi:hypothetical protein
MEKIHGLNRTEEPTAPRKKESPLFRSHPFLAHGLLLFFAICIVFQIKIFVQIGRLNVPVPHPYWGIFLTAGVAFQHLVIWYTKPGTTFKLVAGLIAIFWLLAVGSYGLYIYSS